MTLSASTIDYFAALLFHDYLSLTHAQWMALLDRTVTTGTTALDIPDTLARASMDLGESPTLPCLLVAARERTGNTPARRGVDISCMLLTWLKAADAGAANVAEQLTRAQSAATQAAVENRLRDTEAFNAWLADLDPTRLAGWSILGPMVIANAAPERNAQQHTIHFATTISLTFAVARHAAE